LGKEFHAAAFPARLYYEPWTAADRTLPARIFGGTDKYGNITYNPNQSAEQLKLTLFHEGVHRILSPKLRMFQETRATYAENMYWNHALLRYIEEALAETYAQVRGYGLSSKAVYDGMRFPLESKYGGEGYVYLHVVKKQALQAAGVVATTVIVIGGVSYHLSIIRPRRRR
jgi:hypothetical protein